MGLAPQLDWSRSGNVADVELLYPAPTRFTAFGIENYGYRDRVVYPLRVELERPGEAARLKLDATILVCAEICVPETFTLGLDVPAGATAALDGDGAALIARFAERVPTANGADIAVERIDHDRDSGRYVVTLRGKRPLADPDVFIESEGARFGAPEPALFFEGGTLARIAIPASVDGRRPDDALVTAVDGSLAVEQEVAVSTDDAAYAAPTISLGSAARLAGFLGLAFLGGLILNLMPCVLPVLSIKLAGALSMRAGSDGGDLARIRRGFLWSAAGVMSFALGLAAVLIGLRASGVAVGWGMQFQNPFFLTFVVAVLGLFALSMLDAVHLDLPASWNRRMALAGGLGVEGKGHAGDFLAGAFAALLATPCSAPFLGTAVAFALASGAAETAAVFAALGLGLALPYLVVAARPSLVRRLPRPGPWMAWLRRVLALALAVTAAWLLTVLAANVGWPAALAVAGLIGLAMALLVAPLDRRLRIGTARGGRRGRLRRAGRAGFLTRPARIDTGGGPCLGRVRPFLHPRARGTRRDGVRRRHRRLVPHLQGEQAPGALRPARAGAAERDHRDARRLDAAGRRHPRLSQEQGPLRHPVQCRLWPGGAGGHHAVPNC